MARQKKPVAKASANASLAPVSLSASAATGSASSPPSEAPSIWIVYATPRRAQGAWVKDIQPGRMMFWQHGQANPTSGAPAYSRTIKRGDSVVVLTGDRLVASAIVAAGGDMKFAGPDNVRWWPILFVEVFDEPVPRGAIEEQIGHSLLRNQGAVQPLTPDALEALRGWIEHTGATAPPLPFPEDYAFSRLAAGEQISNALERYQDIEPDEATRKLLQGDEARVIPPTVLPRVFNDRHDQPDLLNIGPEVRAFAQLAINRGIQPPLSIGIFGDWGSGKSFFMKKVEDQVAILSSQAAELDDPGHGQFHQDVAQIRFNAWHYIETNLWASLVAFIFSELDRWLARQDVSQNQIKALFDQLATSRELKLEAYRQLIAARLEQAEADRALLQAQQDYRTSRAEPLNPTEVWSATVEAFKDSLATDQQTELLEAAERIGGAELAKSLEAATRLVDEARQEGARGKLVVSSLIEQAGTVWTAGILIAVLLLPSAAVFGIHRLWPDLAGTLRELAVPFAVSLSGLVALGAVALGRARKGLGVLKRFGAQLDQARLKTKSQVAAAEAQAAIKAQELAEAQRRAADASDRVAALKREQLEQSSVGRLNRFIRDKATGGDYAGHLGIIASVHKDFSQLSDLLKGVATDDDETAEEMRQKTKQAADQYRKAAKAILKDAGKALSTEEQNDLLEAGAEANPLPKIGRIVLYIDDLDRCPPDKVVDVLQAIHMLLFFPLFVVFVAVDARWLTKSLNVQYSKLLATGEDDGKPAAGAQDYLEKIFQIPFAMSPMDPAQSAGFVRRLTQPLLSEEAVAEDEEYLWADDEIDLSAASTGAAPGPGSTAAAPSPEAVRLAPISLSREERTALSAFGALLGGSPRRTKRFVNTYLLIKTGRLGSEDVAPEAFVWPIAAMMAVLIGDRDGASRFFTALSGDPPPAFSMVSTRLKGPGVMGVSPHVQKVVALMEKNAKSTDVEALIRYAPIVRRYAF